MQLSSLTAVSPLDGRYRSKCAPLAEYFSEYALIRYRVKVEVEYFIALCGLGLPQLKDVPTDALERMRSLYKDFSVGDAQRVKEIESVTNHDVKAVEYFIKEHLPSLGLDAWKEFIHFGLTSQDINNTAVPMSIADALREVYLPTLMPVVEWLDDKAQEWAEVALLARTHGQPASPTRLGKEIKVFAYRLREQIDALKAVKISGKFGGATGNFNAHRVAYPDVDWKAFANKFLNENLGIERGQWTTQITNYDNLAQLIDAMRRIDTIIMALERDMWMYISMDSFKQRLEGGEVGSSAMPHKVNPIDFENSEGNCGISSAIYGHLAGKLPVSRLQRDLTDSTVLRNVGVPMGHSLIAFSSTLKGLNKLLLNQQAIDADLDNMWSVVAEGIQTILRREGYPNPYETLKQLTRVNSAITSESIAGFIETLEVSETVKEELRKLSPHSYTGL